VNNKYRNEGFGMQDYEDDLSWVLAKSAAISTQSFGEFA
jgi:hypothetical protein